MLAFTASVLAALLAQASADPPPCAAVRVKGCLPGYIAQYDRLGRLIYVRDPDYIPPMAGRAPTRLAPAPSQIEAPAQIPAWSSEPAQPSRNWSTATAQQPAAWSSPPRPMLISFCVMR